MSLGLIRIVLDKFLVFRSLHMMIKFNVKITLSQVAA